MQINKLLTPYNYNSNTIDRIKYIVIHYVGATGDARANCQYYASQKLNSSAHYFVGFKGDIWQSVEDKDVAWSVGGKKYTGTKGGQYYGICTNANSLNIEMCVRKNSSGWYFEDATVNSAIELTKELMKKYNIDSDHVIRHYDVIGKLCPYPYVYNNTKHTWDDFKKAISEPVIEEGWRKAADGVRWWYALDNDKGYAYSQWLLINKHWYLFDKDGYMLTGLQKWDGKNLEQGELYYLEPDYNSPYVGALYHSKEYGALEVWEVE